MNVNKTWSIQKHLAGNALRLADRGICRARGAARGADPRPRPQPASRASSPTAGLTNDRDHLRLKKFAVTYIIHS